MKKTHGIYGERVPYERMMARAKKDCLVPQGGKILKVLPTLNKHRSTRGNIYYTRCWHVLWECPITHELKWLCYHWQQRRNGHQVYGQKLANHPKAFELK